MKGSLLLLLIGNIGRVGIVAMSNVKRALEELKAAMNKPDKTLFNPYEAYTETELGEMVDEIAGEMERLPPFAISKLKVLTDELHLVLDAIDSYITRKGDNSHD